MINENLKVEDFEISSRFLLDELPQRRDMAEWCKSFGSEWYIPAREELITLNNVIDIVNKTMADNYDISEYDGYYDEIYWSSSQYTSSWAWAVCVSENVAGAPSHEGGWYGGLDKSQINWVVAMKKF